MVTMSLKKQVLEKLLSTENDYLLEEINRLLELEHCEEEVFVLSQTQMATINKSIHQIENGQFITNEALNNKVEQWLNA